MTKDANQRGIVYVADSTFSELLFTSVSSLKKYGDKNNNFKVLIYHFDLSDRWLTRLRGLGENIDFIDANSYIKSHDIAGNLDDIEPNSRHRITRALVYSELSPFATTLYVDSDTLFFDDIATIFDIFEQSYCDIAMATEPYIDPLEPLYYFFGWPSKLDRAKAYKEASDVLELKYPDDISNYYYNAGVICARKGSWASNWVRLLRKVRELPEINKCDSQLLLLASIATKQAKVLRLDPSWNYSYRTRVDGDSNDWQLFIDENKYKIKNDNKTLPLRIFHAIGGIHWIPAFINFPEGFLYLKETMRILNVDNQVFNTLTGLSETNK